MVTKICGAWKSLADKRQSDGFYMAPSASGDVPSMASKVTPVASGSRTNVTGDITAGELALPQEYETTLEWLTAIVTERTKLSLLERQTGYSEPRAPVATFSQAIQELSNILCRTGADGSKY